MADRLGQQFGNYRLVSLLGQGGYAEVYLGQHVRLDLQAAIKVLHTHLTGSEAEHFQQEAQTIARLAHPSIVRVFDFDVQEGVPFLVMDYAPNGSLRQRYPKGSLVPIPQIISCVKQVAAALQYAHDKKFIHRDVKPENMLIGQHQEVLLSDFGIATIAHSSSSLSAGAEGTSGTLAYMAPEQIEGHPRPASDQYALGVVVYEWLCGARPFEGSVSELIAQHLSMPPLPLRERVPAIPAEVEQVVLRALAKDPKARFATVKDFAEALERASQRALAPTAQLASEPAALGPAAATSYDTVVVAPSQPILPTEATPAASLPGGALEPTVCMALARNKPIVCPVLIGRAADLTALYVLVDQAKRGEGQVALISGEAGIGKSRLVAEAKEYAAGQGFFSLQGNCFQTDSAFPYAPFLDLLRSYFSSSSLVTGHHDLAPFAQELSQFLPDVTPLIPESTPLVVPSAPNPQQEKRRLFALLLHFFTRQTTHQPLLFIVEDLHWSDDTSLELLLYLARGCRHLPILFVLTYRSDEVSPELRHCLAELDREHLAQDFSLQRLARADVDAMLGAIFAMHQAMHTGLVESMYALTEGNPFFIEEVLKSLIATGEIASKDGVWERTLLFGTHTRHPSIPRSVQDAVYQRTKQLSAPARQVLRLSAVAGRRFDLAILQQVMHADESHMLVLMKELVAAQFVTEEAADQFSFRHALTRQAVYSELLAGERRALHRTLVETIEQRALPSSILDAQLVDLAYHFYEGEVWSKAAEYGQRAGERALILYAPRAAIEHFTRALAALKRLGSTPSAAVVRARGQAYETIGAFEQARADYEQALSIAQQTQDGTMQWQSLLDIGCLWAGRDYAQAGQWFRKALERAQVLADPKLHARSLNRIGNWLVNLGRAAESLQTHQEALAIFEALQDTQGMAETFDLLGMASGIYGDTIQAVEHTERAIALFRSLSDQQGLISSLATRAAYSCPGWTETTYSVCEPPERCSRDIMETLNLARQVEALIAQTFVSWNGGGSLASFGELGRGFSLAQEALHIATEIQHVQWLSASYFTLGRVYYILLEANLAVQAFETGLRLASDTRSAWWIGNNTAYLARAYLLQGALTSAEEALKAVMPREQPPANTPERRMSWAWGELALASDEPEIALGIADRLLASAPGAARAQPIPWLLKLKGEALGALSRREEAIQALEEATQGALARQERPLLWQLHRSLGRQYHSLKQEDLVQRNFTSARQVIASLASTIDDVYLSEHFLHAALATLPREKAVTASRVAREAFGGLTEREREVAAFIAQGKSNREIADKLVVSYRTVETHVGTILSKLAFSSRAQIALWAVEIGLVKQAE